jgi:hypothetical protein
MKDTNELCASCQCFPFPSSSAFAVSGSLGRNGLSGVGVGLGCSGLGRLGGIIRLDLFVVGDGFVVLVQRLCSSRPVAFSCDRCDGY